MSHNTQENVTIKLHPLTWSDQPKVLTDAPILFSAFMSERCVEVRRGHDGSYYVSAGTLFGSQTLRCDGDLAVFRCLDQISKQRKGKPPEGCSLMEDAA